MRQIPDQIADDDKSELLFKRIRALMQLLEIVSALSVENFVPHKISMNVQPPTGVAGAAGMESSSIENPKAKLAYENALEHNVKMANENSAQLSLQKLQRATIQSIRAMRIILTKFDAKKVENLKKYASLLSLSPSAKRDLENALNNK